MKRTLILTTTLAAALALAAQSGQFHFEDADRNVVVDSASGRIEQTRTGYALLLQGQVVLRQKETNGSLEIRANRVEVTGAGTGRKTSVSRAIATGSVRTTKTATEGRERRTTVIEGTRADYRAAGGDPRVELTGPVRVRSNSATTGANQVRRETLVATGTHGWATLDRPIGEQGPTNIRRMELAGSVRIQLNRANQEGASKVIATAGRMVVDEATTSPTVVLTGNVNVHTEGEGPMFRVRNQRRVVLKLNKQGEMTELNAEPNR